MTDLKIKRWQIVNRHNYIFMRQQQIHPYKSNFEMINYCSNNILLLNITICV